jgi:SEC-C motif-containing protein
MRCPCRKKSETTPYAACCQPYHDGERPPPDVEALMRSRYSAFVREDRSYLLETWHPSTRPATVVFEPGQQWLSLRIKAVESEGSHGRVAFEARSRTGGRSHVLSENSRFVFENGRWFYVDAVGGTGGT